MAVIRCPQCQFPMLENEASSGKCRGCGTLLPGELVPERTEELARPALGAPTGTAREREDAPPSIAAENVREVLGWGTLRVALLLIALGLFLILGGVGVFVLGTAALLYLTAADARQVVPPLLLVMGLSLSLGAAQVVTGLFLCLATPARSGARGWVVGCLLCLAAVFLAQLLILNYWMEPSYAYQTRRGYDQEGRWQESAPLLEGARPEVRFLTYMVLGAGLVGALFFMVFLCNLAWHMRRTGLLVSLLVYLALSMLFLACMGYSLFLLGMRNPTAGLPGVTVTALLLVVMVGPVFLAVGAAVHALLVRAAITRALLGRTF